MAVAAPGPAAARAVDALFTPRPPPLVGSDKGFFFVLIQVDSLNVLSLLLRSTATYEWQLTLLHTKCQNKRQGFEDFF